MHARKREISRVTISVLSGSATALIIAGTIAYMFGWFTHWLSVPLRLLVLQVLTYELPITIFASTMGVGLYRLILKPPNDTETRCRQCGYILKGLSKPECSECGEAI